MSFSRKNWASQVKHCTMTSTFWFWETAQAWYVKICLKNTSHHLFLYFLNFWVHFTYVHYDQPKMVDLPNITHAINSWQFLQGKKTAYWMYFGLYIRWKFRKHYGKHSGHGSVHLWHHSGTSLFLILLCSSDTRALSFFERLGNDCHCTVYVQTFIYNMGNSLETSLFPPQKN